MNRRTLIATCLILLGIPGTSSRPVLAVSASPEMRVIAVPGYQTAVLGRHWLHRGRLVFSVQTGSWTQGLVLRATRAGTFRVGVNTISLCGGLTIAVRDLAHHKVTIHLAGPLECASPAHPPMPTISVLTGTLLHPHTQSVIGIRPVKVTLRVGQELEVVEPGLERPSYTAKVDAGYLFLVAHGVTSPLQACPSVNCGSKFYWRWIALREGHTVIDLSPACREVRPPCGLPDFGIDVRILR